MAEAGLGLCIAASHRQPARPAGWPTLLAPLAAHPAGRPTPLAPLAHPAGRPCSAQGLSKQKPTWALRVQAHRGTKPDEHLP